MLYNAKASEKNQTGHLKLMNKWVFVILQWWVLQILVILSPPQGLNGTVTKALVPCLEQYGEKEILNRSSLMVQSDTMFWLQRILSHGLLTSQICWQNSTSHCSSVLQKWSGLAGALFCLPFKSIYPPLLPPKPR